MSVIKHEAHKVWCHIVCIRGSIDEVFICICNSFLATSMRTEGIRIEAWRGMSGTYRVVLGRGRWIMRGVREWGGVVWWWTCCVVSDVVI